MKFQDFKSERDRHMRSVRDTGILTQVESDALLTQIQYIEDLAAKTSTDISLWEMEMFALNGIDWWKIQPERREINKLFFAKMDEQKAHEPPAEMTEEILKAIASADELAKKALIDDLQFRIGEQITAANRRIADGYAYLGAAASYRAQQRTIQNRTLPIAAMVAEVQKMGFFKFERVEYDRLVFETTADVVLTHGNPSSGQHYRVNLGRFKITVSIGNSRLNVSRHQNNVLVSGYYHPHVSAQGEVCWGNGLTTATDALSKMDLPRVFRVLHGVLTTYNDGSPYVSLYDFQRMQTGSAPPGFVNTPPQPPCDLCNEQPDDCQCHFCEACDQRYADGDSCEGNYCDVCSECRGSEPCETHYCTVCSEYSRRPSDCCCTDCDNTVEECECEEEEEEEEPEESSSTTSTDVVFVDPVAPEPHVVGRSTVNGVTTLSMSDGSTRVEPPEPLRGYPNGFWAEAVEASTSTPTTEFTEEDIPF